MERTLDSKSLLGQQMLISIEAIFCHVVSFEGIVGCTRTNVPLYGKSLYKPYIHGL